MLIKIKAISPSTIDQIEKTHVFQDNPKHRIRLEQHQNNEVAYLFAWREDEPIGHILLKLNGFEEDPVNSRISECPHIEDLFVHPNHRSRGIGSQLLRYAETVALRRGYVQVGLSINIENDYMRQLYASKGYVSAGISGYKSDRYIDHDGQDNNTIASCIYLVKAVGRTGMLG